MTPDAQGRFCAHCQKSVIDFTTWSDKDLYAFFSKNNQSVCGRFQAYQLNRTIQLPAQKQTRLYRIAIALGLSLMFTQLPTTHARPKPPLTEQSILTVQEIPQNDSTDSDSLVIRGTILDFTKEPAVNAIINVERNGKTITGTTTGIDGNYTIAIHKKDGEKIKVKVVLFGHTTTTVAIDSLTQNIELNLTLEKAKEIKHEIYIMGRTPVLNSKHPGPNTTFSREQLKQTAR